GTSSGFVLALAPSAPGGSTRSARRSEAIVSRRVEERPPLRLTSKRNLPRRADRFDEPRQSRDVLVWQAARRFTRGRHLVRHQERPELRRFQLSSTDQLGDAIDRARNEEKELAVVGAVVRVSA